MLTAAAGAAELPGRYVFEKVEEGYLRLDSATGSVSLCARKAGLWQCAAISDDLALASENEWLKKRVEALENSRFAVALPADRDIAKLLALLNKMVDSLVDMSLGLERRGAI
jgi:hypothetical protein